MLAFELLNGKRPHELLLLKLLIRKNRAVSRIEYIAYLEKNNVEYSSKLIQSVERVLTLDFFIAQARAKYGKPLIEVTQDNYLLSPPSNKR